MTHSVRFFVRFLVRYSARYFDRYSKPKKNQKIASIPNQDNIKRAINKCLSWKLGLDEVKEQARIIRNVNWLG